MDLNVIIAPIPILKDMFEVCNYSGNKGNRENGMKIVEDTSKEKYKENRFAFLYNSFY